MEMSQAVFLSIIKHLCQKVELVLTERSALSWAELVLTATSSQQIYTCTHSETTPELIAKSWTHMTMSLAPIKLQPRVPSELGSSEGERRKHRNKKSSMQV